MGPQGNLSATTRSVSDALRANVHPVTTVRNVTGQRYRRPTTSRALLRSSTEGAKPTQSAPPEEVVDPKSLSKAERAEVKKKQKQPERELSGAERKNYALNRSGSVKVVVLGNKNALPGSNNKGGMIPKAMSLKIVKRTKGKSRERAEKLSAANAGNENERHATRTTSLRHAGRNSDRERNPLFEPLPEQVEKYLNQANKRIAEEERRASLAEEERRASLDMGGNNNSAPHGAPGPPSIDDKAPPEGRPAGGSFGMEPPAVQEL
mmetsp:Transcript_23963/g.60150  ORF Transcript_23963/g.60150 Transcript_23963/m.60150 type:complete len:264 (+) Transcript_23963:195-986(+)